MRSEGEGRRREGRRRWRVRIEGGRRRESDKGGGKGQDKRANDLYPLPVSAYHFVADLHHHINSVD